MSENSFTSSHDSLVRRVGAFGAFRKRQAVLAGAATFIAITAGTLLAWVLLDCILKMPAWPLLITFVIATLIAFFVFITSLAQPCARRVVPNDEAILMESLAGGLDNQIIGAFQLGAEARAENVIPGHSLELVEALVHRAKATLDSLQPERLIDRKPLKRATAWAGVVLVAWGVLVAVSPAVVSGRLSRLADAWDVALDTFFPIELRVESGDITALRGSTQELVVHAIGGRRSSIELLIEPKSGEARGEPLALDASRKARYPFEATSDFVYRFRYGGRVSSEHHVRVGDRPEVAAMHFELAYPAYTGVPPRTLVGRLPRVQALAATHVQVSLAATTDLHPEQSFVRWQDGSRQPLSVTGRFAGFSFTMEKPDRATIVLAGSLGKGFEAAEPSTFEVVVEKDAPPKVELLLKNRKMTMLGQEAAAFAANWVAEDDFGIAEVSLEYKIDSIDPLLGRSPRSGTIPRQIEPARDRVKGQFADAFKALSPPLEPGDRITLTITAKDNNTETGPSMGRSAPVEIVVVRPDLAGFTQQELGFGGESALGGLRRIKRSTNLLVDPDTTVRKEPVREIDRQDLRARAGGEGFPSGSEDAVGDYFRLLSGDTGVTK